MTVQFDRNLAANCTERGNISLAGRTTLKQHTPTAVNRCVTCYTTTTAHTSQRAEVKSLVHMRPHNTSPPDSRLGTPVYRLWHVQCQERDTTCSVLK